MVSSLYSSHLEIPVLLRAGWQWNRGSPTSLCGEAGERSLTETPTLIDRR